MLERRRSEKTKEEDDKRVPVKSEQCQKQSSRLTWMNLTSTCTVGFQWRGLDVHFRLIRKQNGPHFTPGFGYLSHF